MNPDREEIRCRIMEVIGRGPHTPLPDHEFEPLALSVFRYQFGCNEPYRAYCEARGATPERVRRWEDVPAVPTDAFKAAALICGGPEVARAVFRTSGTTSGKQRRGAHYFRDLSLYDAALLAGFRAHLVPDIGRARILSLVPRPEDQTDSSLSHMVGVVMEAFGEPGSGWFVDSSEGLDTDRLLDALREAEREAAPILLLGTSFAFVHLFDALIQRDERFRLPAGSRGMDTGGFKGRSREVARTELVDHFVSLLGIPQRAVLNEYGMTEMSSQFYAEAGGLHRGPVWVRSRAYDPETLQPVAPGEVGVLRHWDLANLDSVMALQTADLGAAHPAGLELIGRARGAEARGCSIAMDELLTAIRQR